MAHFLSADHVRLRDLGDLSNPNATYSQSPNFADSDSESVNYANTKSNDNTNSAHRQYKFVRWKQLVQLLLKGAFRFPMTLLLCGALYWTLQAFSAMSFMDVNQKRIFNFIITALSMALGINIASAFKSAALNARWWILSHKARPLKEIDNILQCDSLSHGVKTALSSGRKGKWMAMVVCLSWLAINIIAQAAVAMLGLNYSIESAPNVGGAVPGKVVFTNLTNTFYGEDPASQSLDSLKPIDQLAAHMYGSLSLFLTNETWASCNSSNPNALPIVPVTLYDDNNSPDFFLGTNYTQYVFRDWPEIAGSSVSWYSNRSIAASSSCTVYKVIQGVNGTSDDFTYFNGTVGIHNPFKMVAPRSTTYYTSPDLGTCGPRCANVCAFENNGTAGWYYECEIYVGNVTNATLPSQQLSDRSAKMAAGAIALQGYQSEQETDQYQRFPAGIRYGHYLSGNATLMARAMRNFAAATIAGMDQNNANIDDAVDSLVPASAVTLTLDHPKFIIAILASIIGGHLMLYIIATLLANQVVVIDDSPVSVAMVLRPVIDKITNRGSVLLGKKSYDPTEKVRYGACYGDDQRRRLEISADVKKEKNWEGYYD